MMLRWLLACNTPTFSTSLAKLSAVISQDTLSIWPSATSEGGAGPRPLGRPPSQTTATYEGGASGDPASEGDGEATLKQLKLNDHRLQAPKNVELQEPAAKQHRQMFCWTHG